MTRLHLVCNAHLDPYWQWNWEEGAAEALSTFRTAADLCEEFDGSVFNHNEVILYRWIEEYEPSLFQRIQRLVREGKWHIMGGWYVQPDCNMPSGESFVRQILLGRVYFRDKFGARPTTAINFDPFGHTRGLVQILAKSGYHSYLCCRPGQNDCPLPADDILWRGYDGSEVLCHRVSTFYNSGLGHAREKVEKWLEQYPDREIGIVLWGVGNHGGGPSRQDLRDLASLIESENKHEILHSVPEHYFAELKKQSDIPVHASDLNPWGVGCYTSMIRVKQKHRQLENELFMVEKMMSAAALQGLLDYGWEYSRAIHRDLATAQFHDILPGSSIQDVEDTALRLLDHGLELTARLKARAFFALCSGQPKCEEGQLPVVLYNPHPYPVTGVFECESMLADVNHKEEFTVLHVTQDGQKIPCQTEKERSNLNLDWRKKVVWQATLPPCQVSRFDCSLETLPTRPTPTIEPVNGELCLGNDQLDFRIDCQTGLVNCYRVNGTDYLQVGACQPMVMQDNEDPWGMLVHSYREQAGAFVLMTPAEATAFCGVKTNELSPIRVVEAGPVRTVVEVNFRYGGSAILQTYRIPKQGTEVEVEIRAQWQERDKMLKWALPTTLACTRWLGQQAFGVEELPQDRECCAQKWSAVIDDRSGLAFTTINDGVYGCDCQQGELRHSLLRSPAYCGHPIGERDIVPQDRFTPRIDQGERLFRFWLNAGEASERLDRIDREALVHNEPPFALSFFPSGSGEVPAQAVVLEDDVVVMTAFKKMEAGSDYIVRLHEPTGQHRETRLNLPALGITQHVELEAFEAKTWRIDLESSRLVETNLIEEDLI